MDYSDKEFKELYSETLENIKTLTKKWDPSVSDESDPGVAILKAFTLFSDKLQYKFNYREAQNSVRRVTDRESANELFFDLGYQIKKKRSATGELSIRYLGNEEATLPIFTQFSNESGSLVYTSILKDVNFLAGEPKLIKVQEGIPNRYTYLGVSEFDINNLSTDLRLSLKGYENLAINGVVICSLTEETGAEGVSYSYNYSNWVNTEDTIFTSVETKNIYSVGHDVEGVPYIQFYESSLADLKENKIGIWIISSSGSAGNCSANKINKISFLPNSQNSTLDLTLFIVNNPEFSNGEDPEPLEEALKNYYNTFGVNNTLVSERDYQVILENTINQNLEKLTSKALVTGVNGYHNLIEVVSELDSGKQAIFIKFILTTLISKIFVNALEYSDDYYTSFRFLQSDLVQNEIKKAIFRKDIVSNDLLLVGSKGDIPSPGTTLSTIFDRFIFDVGEVAGTLITNSIKDISEIEDEVVSAISEKFNSRNLTAGEMISESALAKAVKDKLDDVVDISFYYKNHILANSISTKDNGVSLDPISVNDRKEIITRSILRGNAPLWKKALIQLLPGATLPTSDVSTNIHGYFPSSDHGVTLDTTRFIKKLQGIYTVSSRVRTLNSNEFIQFYTESKMEKNTYGLGIRYRLLTPQKSLTSQLVIMAETLLKPGSKIKSGSKLYSPSTLEYRGYHGGISTDIPGITVSGDVYTFGQDYVVENYILCTTYSGVYLTTGSIPLDGSVLNGSDYYNLSLESGKISDLTGAKLILQIGDSLTDILVLDGNSEEKWVKTNFTLNSSGPIESTLSEYDPLLTSSQTITTLISAKVNLDTRYYYGVILNNKTSFPTNPYVLEEGEHFIYSDSDKIDFVDFGSGTKILATDLSKFKNCSLTEKDLENIGNKLTRLETPLTLTNTDITTYSEGEKVTFPDSSPYPYTDFGESWKGVQNGKEFKVEIGSSEIIYGPGYWYRTGLVIKTSENQAFKLLPTQKIKLIDDQDASKVFDNQQVVTSTIPLYINSADVNFVESQGFRLAAYGLEIAEQHNFYVDLEYTDEDGYTFTATSTSSSGNYFEVKLNNKKYLIEVEVEGTLDTTTAASVSGTGSKVIILNMEEFSGDHQVTGGGKYSIYAEGSSLGLTFTGIPEGNTVKITNFRVLDDYSEYLSLTPEVTGDAVFDKINDYLLISTTESDKVPFDFWFEPESPIKGLLDPINLYDPQHLMNRNILTVIDLKKLKKNLQIVRRGKW